MRLMFLVVLLLSALTQIPCDAEVHLVRSDGSGDYPTIQQGLDAIPPGDTLLLAPGTYTGSGNRNLNFHGKDLVVLGDNDVLPVVIDCNGLGRGFWFHSEETLAAVVEGVRIRNGVGIFDQLGGGAILIADAAPTITDCYLEECFAWEAGGGIYIAGSSGSSPRPHVTRCVIRGNIVGDSQVDDCRGGGLACGGGAIISDCVITGNRIIPTNSTATAGGVYVQSSSDPEVLLTGCTISGNQAQVIGGIVATQSLMLERCVVWGNCGTQSFDEIYTGERSFLLCCATNPSECNGDVQFIGDQVFTDPLFCDPADCGDAPTVSGTYELQHDSPCRTENSPCGELIGALDQGCEVAAVPTRLLPIERPIVVRPNPYENSAEIILDRSAVVGDEAVIRDVSGRQVAVLSLDGPGGALVWNGNDDRGRQTPTGVYFVSVQTANGWETARIVRIH